MDWNMIQQLIRILLQFGSGALVTNGVITQDMATAGVGAVMSLAGILWWVLWERKRQAAIAPSQ